MSVQLTAEELERSYENEKSKLLEMMHHHGLSDKDGGYACLPHRPICLMFSAFGH